MTELTKDRSFPRVIAPRVHRQRASEHGKAYDHWKIKTVETRPDGSEHVVYTNCIGQILIKELRAGSQRWIESRTYDADGRQIERARPSAVVDCDDAYDAATGARVQTIQDVDTSQVGDAPAGWTTPAGGGLHLITDYQHDARGRLIEELGPWHTVDLNGTATPVRTARWTVYRDAAHEIWTAAGYATGTAPDDTYTLVNPVAITRSDHNGNVLEQIQAVRGRHRGQAPISVIVIAICRFHYTAKHTQLLLVSDCTLALQGGILRGGSDRSEDRRSGPRLGIQEGGCNAISSSVDARPKAPRSRN